MSYAKVRTLPMLRSCSLCGIKRNRLVELELDGTVYLFCNNMEAEQGLANYAVNKKQLGLSDALLPDESSLVQEIKQTSLEDNT